MSIPVVHVTLARVIPQQAVDHDQLFVFGEPPILSTEPISGLRRARRHQTPREETDDESYDTLDKEASQSQFRSESRDRDESLQPSPTGPSCHTSHLKYTSSD